MRQQSASEVTECSMLEYERMKGKEIRAGQLSPLSHRGGKSEKKESAKARHQLLSVALDRESKEERAEKRREYDPLTSWPEGQNKRR